MAFSQLSMSSSGLQATGFRVTKLAIVVVLASRRLARTPQQRSRSVMMPSSCCDSLEITGTEPMSLSLRTPATSIALSVDRQHTGFLVITSFTFMRTTSSALVEQAFGEVARRGLQHRIQPSSPGNSLLTRPQTRYASCTESLIRLVTRGLLSHFSSRASWTAAIKQAERWRLPTGASAREGATPRDAGEDM